ncbi:MAG TPA: hypothetical protein VMV54_09035 [Acidocella sp.]|nr:hypothetical protein [Acidocella sp.]
MTIMTIQHLAWTGILNNGTCTADTIPIGKLVAQLLAASLKSA